MCDVFTIDLCYCCLNHYIFTNSTLLLFALPVSVLLSLIGSFFSTAGKLPAAWNVTIEDFKARVDDPALDIDASSIMVLKGCGPKGYPGMPEVGNMPLPAKLLEQGVNLGQPGSGALNHIIEEIDIGLGILVFINFGT